VFLIDGSVRPCYAIKMPRHQTNRWKHDRPSSLQQFMATFPDDAACAEWLAHRRWPTGFVCPACSGLKGWKLEAKPWTWEYAGCGRQTSTTAGTMMHRTHLRLRTWFLAAHLVATHSNGISALQLQAKLGIGSYKTAWLLLHKLRKAMVDPERDPLEGMVEVDESSLVYPTKDDPVAGGQGRSAEGKILIAAAVETLSGGKAGRIRLTTIGNYSAATLQRFVADNTVDGSTILTDGFSAYPGNAQPQPRAEGRRRHGRPFASAVGPPGVRQPRAAGARRLSRLPPQAHSGLPRRIRLPLEPAPTLPIGI
jgi:hypothetical protein